MKNKSTSLSFLFAIFLVICFGLTNAMAIQDIILKPGNEIGLRKTKTDLTLPFFYNTYPEGVMKYFSVEMFQREKILKSQTKENQINEEFGLDLKADNDSFSPQNIWFACWGIDLNPLFEETFCVTENQNHDTLSFIAEVLKSSNEKLIRNENKRNIVILEFRLKEADQKTRDNLLYDLSFLPAKVYLLWNKNEISELPFFLDDFLFVRMFPAYPRNEQINFPSPSMLYYDSGINNTDLEMVSTIDGQTFQLKKGLQPNPGPGETLMLKKPFGYNLTLKKEFDTLGFEQAEKLIKTTVGNVDTLKLRPVFQRIIYIDPTYMNLLSINKTLDSIVKQDKNPYFIYLSNDELYMTATSPMEVRAIQQRMFDLGYTKANLTRDMDRLIADKPLFNLMKRVSVDVILFLPDISLDEDVEIVISKMSNLFNEASVQYTIFHESEHFNKLKGVTFIKLINQ